MTKSQGRPVTVNGEFPLRTSISLDMNTALMALVAATGEARSSIVRRGVARVLSEAGLWDETQNARIVITPAPTPKENHS